MNYCKLYAKLFRDWTGYIKKLREYEIEIGMPICREEGRIRMGGKAALGYRMSLSLKCESGVKEASIHSHISSDKASLQDHITAILNGDLRQCIIYNKDGDEYIKCYSYENFPKEELVKDIITMNETINRNKENYNKLLNEYDKKFFLCNEKID